MISWIDIDNPIKVDTLSTEFYSNQYSITQTQNLIWSKYQNEGTITESQIKSPISSEYTYSEIALGATEFSPATQPPFTSPVTTINLVSNRFIKERAVWGEEFSSVSSSAGSRTTSSAGPFTYGTYNYSQTNNVTIPRNISTYCYTSTTTTASTNFTTTRTYNANWYAEQYKDTTTVQSTTSKAIFTLKTKKTTYDIDSLYPTIYKAQLDEILLTYKPQMPENDVYSLISIFPNDIISTVQGNQEFQIIPILDYSEDIQVNDDAKRLNSTIKRKVITKIDYETLQEQEFENRTITTLNQTAYFPPGTFWEPSRQVRYDKIPEATEFIEPQQGYEISYYSEAPPIKSTANFRNTKTYNNIYFNSQNAQVESYKDTYTILDVYDITVNNSRGIQRTYSRSTNYTRGATTSKQISVFKANYTRSNISKFGVPINIVSNANNINQYQSTYGLTSVYLNNNKFCSNYSANQNLSMTNNILYAPVFRKNISSIFPSVYTLMDEFNSFTTVANIKISQTQASVSNIRISTNQAWRSSISYIIDFGGANEEKFYNSIGTSSPLTKRGIGIGGSLNENNETIINKKSRGIFGLNDDTITVIEPETSSFVKNIELSYLIPQNYMSYQENTYLTNEKDLIVSTVRLYPPLPN
jgi:hypothetical protein